MLEATTATIAFPSTDSKDVLTDILRDGAQRLLAVAVVAEADRWIEEHKAHVDEEGHRQVVRNGYLPERTIQKGVGSVSVKQPRVRDRRPEGEREKFTSAILPPCLRNTKSIEELLPWLYLQGVSTGDFSEALAALHHRRDGAGRVPDRVRIGSAPAHQKTPARDGSSQPGFSVVFGELLATCASRFSLICQGPSHCYLRESPRAGEF